MHIPSTATLVAIALVPLVAWRVFDTAVPRSLAEFGQSPLTRGSFGLMAGYYWCYMLGLLRWRWRVLGARRERAARPQAAAATPGVE